MSVSCCMQRGTDSKEKLHLIGTRIGGNFVLKLFQESLHQSYVLCTDNLSFLSPPHLHSPRCNKRSVVFCILIMRRILLGMFEIFDIY